MDQLNAIIDCDLARLDFALRPLKARQGHNFVAAFRRVPADFSGLFIRIFRTGGAYYDVTAHEHPDGGWSCRIPAACFPATGEFRYEVHAVAADDEPAALGEGRLKVDAFSVTATPLPIGATQEVAQLPCEGGGYVQVVMKWDGHEWMPEAVVSGNENDGGESDE